MGNKKKYYTETMLKADTTKLCLLMAKQLFDNQSLADAAGISKNVLYAIRRGNYAKPKYFGAIAAALHCEVSDIVADESSGNDTGAKYSKHNELSFYDEVTP